MELALRVVAPLAIHEEPVMMLARGEFQIGSPYTVCVFFQIHWCLIPKRKIPCQLHARSTRCSKGEDLLSAETVFAQCLFLHVFPLVATHRLNTCGLG